MHFNACLPESWWNFAFHHACYLDNQTPQAWLDWHTPYKTLEGEKPVMNHIRVFGYGAYVYLPKGTYKDKMSLKSELMIYLGITSGEHGNLFMCLPGNIVFTFAHADFDEKSFSRCKDTKQ